MLPLLCLILYFCSFTLGDENKIKLLPGTDVCGKQKEERIYGGEEANIGEFPWLALLEDREYGESDFICGGALINNRYVLTAAHCMGDTVESVRLGEHNLKTKEDCEGDTPGLDYCSDPPVDIEIEERISHESFDPDSDDGYGDIALLRLSKEVNYTDFIKPICLPLSPELKTKPLVGEKAVVAGWGKTEKERMGSSIKLKVELPIESNNHCAKAYRERGIHLSGSQLCAGGEKGKDSCQGDSGGPLMYNYKTADEENWMCVGVVSFGVEKCGIEHIAGVYTRVTEFMPWILEKIQP